MFIILKRVPVVSDYEYVSDYGFIIAHRNFSVGRKYHQPSRDALVITQRIYQHGFIAPPNKELDDLISIGTKLWMNNPENILDSFADLVVDALESFTLKFTRALINDKQFRVFEHFYFSYNQRDEYVDLLVSRRWSYIVDQFNLRMELDELPATSFITEEESEYLKILVIRLITRGIRYCLLVYKGNAQLANHLFEMTHTSLEPYTKGDYYSDLFISINKKEEKLVISSEKPANLTRFAKYFSL